MNHHFLCMMESERKRKLRESTTTHVWNTVCLILYYYTVLNIAFISTPVLLVPVEEVKLIIY